jgi:DNA-binding transcriptional MerR regulator
MHEPRWTLDELAERVDVALAVDYAGPPSARVRAVPDRRAIRWYTTIGLIDRPVAHRGRTALYGPRHLLQLVAVKRLQASGRPLVAIQQELAGATDTQLARVARLPGGPAALDGGGSFVVRDAEPRAAAQQPLAGPPRAVAGRVPRAGFWRQQAAAFTTTADPGLPVETLRGVRLGEGATLLLEPGRPVDAADVQAVLDAARPLLAVLRERGLGTSELRREHP